MPANYSILLNKLYKQRDAKIFTKRFDKLSKARLTPADFIYNIKLSFEEGAVPKRVYIELDVWEKAKATVNIIAMQLNNGREFLFRDFAPWSPIPYILHFHSAPFIFKADIDVPCEISFNYVISVPSIISIP